MLIEPFKKVYPLCKVRTKLIGKSKILRAYF